MKSAYMVAIGATLAGVIAYAIWPKEPLPLDTKIDSVLVLKSERKLLLLSQGTAVKQYTISLGHNPAGRKTQAGDLKTPEGPYVIDYRNTQSAYHLALHISYPNSTERAQALARNVDPGGDIMIHGMKNGFGFVGRWHRWVDWTAGCIAVTDDEIEEIAGAVKDGTSIEIRA